MMQESQLARKAVSTNQRRINVFQGAPRHSAMWFARELSVVTLCHARSLSKPSPYWFQAGANQLRDEHLKVATKCSVFEPLMDG